METIAPSALVVAILYVLTRWMHATVEHAVAHPDNGRPDITWRLTWWIAIIVSALSAASVHVWLLTKTAPGWEVFAFNGVVEIAVCCSPSSAADDINLLPTQIRGHAKLCSELYARISSA